MIICTKRREKQEIVNSILHHARNGILPRPLCSKANLNYVVLMQYVEKLLELGLLKEETVQFRKNGEKHRFSKQLTKEPKQEECGLSLTFLFMETPQHWNGNNFWNLDEIGSG